MLEYPAPVRAPLVADEFHCFAQARVTRRVDCLKVVERAENVVVPPWRKRHAPKLRADDATRAVRTKQSVLQQELASLLLRAPDIPGAAALFVEPQPFENTDRRVHRRMRRTSPALAIPATVGHLLAKQIVYDLVAAIVPILEVAAIERIIPAMQVSLRSEPKLTPPSDFNP